MRHLSDKFMLDMLKKVQPYQSKIYATGRSAHLDAHVHENIWEEDMDDHHLNFDLIVFEGTSLVKSFEFNSSDTEAEVEAVLTMLDAYSKSL